MKKALIKNNFHLQRSQRTRNGSVLVFALIILSFILVTAFSLASISLIDRRSSGSSVNSSTAFQNSDKGMEEFLQQLYKDLAQTDNLNIMASAIAKGGTIYQCYDGIGSGELARIGDQDTEFIITAYKEGNGTGGGWDAVVPITDCNELLADISRLHIIGNYSNTSRAVFLKLRDSLTRGLVAHWTFEDRKLNAGVATTVPSERNSLIADDLSTNRYTLTLCQMYVDNDPPVVSVTMSATETKYIVPFTECDNPNSEVEKAMVPFKYDQSCSAEDCDINGAWRDGIVQADGQPGEALWFDGNDDYLTALTDSGDCYVSGCSDTLNYVDSESTGRLDLDEGIAVSAWVKVQNDSGEKVIVSKWHQNDGYKLYVNEGDICLDLNNKKLCGSHDGDIKSGDWAHIVAVWRKNEIAKIYVNGQNVLASGLYSNNINIPVDVPLSIGAQLDDNGNMNTSNGFHGKIDDVRIWNRALTTDEVCQLCWDAGQEAQLICDPTCNPTNL